MIRSYLESDLPALLDVWYRASVVAHSFLPEGFFRAERREIAERWLPMAETVVYEMDGCPVGFIALIGNEVGAIFVDPNHQGRGVGRALMDWARDSRPYLELSVFEANKSGGVSTSSTGSSRSVMESTRQPGTRSFGFGWGEITDRAWMGERRAEASRTHCRAEYSSDVGSEQLANVTALQRAEQPRAAEVLARAFHDDPIWTRVFTDPVARPDALVNMFGAFIKATVAADGVAETTPRNNAVALWLRPGTDIGLRAMLGTGLALPRFMFRLAKQERKRMMAALRQINQCRGALMPEPHWYLSAIGVDPDHQGSGLGAALVRAGIRRADQMGSPTYLETETMANVRFYERLGFEVIEEIRVVSLGIPVWLMVRRTPERGAADS